MFARNSTANLWLSKAISMSIGAPLRKANIATDLRINKCHASSRFHVLYWFDNIMGKFFSVVMRKQKLFLVFHY